MFKSTVNDADIFHYLIKTKYTNPNIQWAAVRILTVFKIVPPQKWLFADDLKDTMKGYAPAGAVEPPIIFQSPFTPILSPFVGIASRAIV